jgi:hypothetical protein
MKTKIYFAGVIAASITFYFAFVANVYSTPTTMHAAAVALSYFVFSTLAFVLTSFGSKRSSKAALFFGCGVVLLFTFLLSLRYLMGWFYISGDYYDQQALRAFQDLYFYSPMIVSALCIYRGISIWADESIAKKEPNQPPEPMSGLTPGHGSS